MLAARSFDVLLEKIRVAKYPPSVTLDSILPGVLRHDLDGMAACSESTS